MLQQIRAELTSERDTFPLNVIISVGSWEGRTALASILPMLAPNEGVAIDAKVPPRQSSQYFDLGFTRANARWCNQAYGNGIFTLGPEGSIRKQLMEAVARKAAEKRIKFVYVWTLAAAESVAEYLSIGVDGIFVDDPRIALKVLDREPYRSRFRLATRVDRVFQPPVIPAYVLKVKTGDRSGAGTDANIGFHLVGETGGQLSTSISTFKKGLFERGAVDLVTLRGQDVGTPQRLTVTTDRSGNKPGWFLESIEVQNTDDMKCYLASFSRWF